MSKLSTIFKVSAFVAATAIVGAGATAKATTTIDLGFIIDGSASVGSTNFNAARDALAAAINTYVPTNDPNYTYTIGVAVFGTNGVAAVDATAITDATSKAAVVSAIQGIAYNSGYGTGSTNYNGGFTALNTAWSNSSLTVGTGIVNMTTDGNNNVGTPSNGILQGAGWDSLSFEAVGGSVSTAPLVALGYDALGPGAPLIANASLISDPLNNAFTLTVANFGTDYSTAIDEKIYATVNPPAVPLPGTVPLFVSGLGALGLLHWRRKKKAAAIAA